MPWSSVTLVTTTPVFNAGGDQDNADDAGVRVPSLRGAMRFWFRALAGTVTGPDLGLLAAVESRVFGNAGTPSPLALRITRQPGTRVKQQADFLPPSRVTGQRRSAHEGRWIVYLLGQALGDLGDVKLRRPYVPAGEAIELRYKFTHPRGTDQAVADAVEYLATASLWLTCAFGGVGARVRRGFGGLRIEAASDLPAPWTAAGHPTSPGLAFFEELTHLDAAELLPPAAGHLATLARDQGADAAGSRGVGAAGNQGADGVRSRGTDGARNRGAGGAASTGARPAFPVLTRAWTTAGITAERTPEWGSWDRVLIHAGEQLRHFRASRAYPGAGYHPPIKTPEWNDTIHRAGPDFPVGALGLPVVYKEGFAVKVHDHHQVELRRASPLWLRPVGEGKSWRLLSFALRAEFLSGSLSGPDRRPSVRVWEHSRSKHPVTIADADVDRLTRQWIETLAVGGSFVSSSSADGSVTRT
jgi:CRISPR type III-B/RAMP module RAMP protein Cmr1